MNVRMLAIATIRQLTTGPQPSPLISLPLQLQTLKKNLEKDTEDDETVLQNTYRPEQGSPRFTKNRRREREAVEKVLNIDHDEEEPPQPSKGKRKSKRELPPPRVRRPREWQLRLLTLTAPYFLISPAL